MGALVMERGVLPQVRTLAGYAAEEETEKKEEEQSLTAVRRADPPLTGAHAGARLLHEQLRVPLLGALVRISGTSDGAPHASG